MSKLIGAWLYEQEDAERAPGWYAIALCWDPEEGTFPGADYWDGNEWTEGGPIIATSPGTLASKFAADEWARYHDVFR